MKRPIPDWFKKGAVYQINPRTFSAEGTISAVTAELPVLSQMGFGIMYLCPIFKTDESADKGFWSARQLKSETDNPKNPYRMTDYFEIDEEYGSMDDLKEFVAHAHSLGMRVILDLVYLHIGVNAEMFKEHPDFAVREADGSIKLTRWNFAYLNFDSEGLREYLYCNMAYYVGVIGADGFRCDVGDEVPLDFWEEGTRRIRKIKPDAVMINEGKKADYLDVFDANYGFYWHRAIYDLLAGNVNAEAVIAEHKMHADAIAGRGLILRDMDNHDTVTDWPWRIEAHYGHDAMELILAANYTIDGVPMVYCGNELADTARLSMFANRFHPGKFEFTDRRASSPEVERRKEIVTKLNALRRECSPLSEGRTEWIATESEKILAFKRVSEDGEIIFIGNFSDSETDLPLELCSASVILSNNCKIKKDRVTLSEYGYTIVAY